MYHYQEFYRLAHHCLFKCTLLLRKIKSFLWERPAPVIYQQQALGTGCTALFSQNGQLFPV